MPRQVYLDHAAATPTDQRVAIAMEPYQTAVFANPSSLHTAGQQAARAIIASREAIARLINANPEDIFFTSSGTESNNLALLGVARANRSRGDHIVTTVIEHPSILNTCRSLEKDGFRVTYLPVNNEGLVDLNDLTAALTAKTILVTTHYGNSELGVLQPIDEIGNICRERGIYFHVDACQAMAYAKVDVRASNINLLTFNGSKMYGPKGVAVLYVREGVQIFPIMYGGGQQRSLRSGTENVPTIVGMSEAAKIIIEQRENDVARIERLRNQLRQALEEVGAVVNVKSSSLLPNHLSVVLPEAKTTDLVAYFDSQGISVSSGSACSSRSMAESYVLQAIGLTSEKINKTIRITLGRSSSSADINATVTAVKKI